MGGGSSPGVLSGFRAVTTRAHLKVFFFLAGLFVPAPDPHQKDAASLASVGILYSGAVHEAPPFGPGLGRCTAVGPILFITCWMVFRGLLDPSNLLRSRR